MLTLESTFLFLCILILHYFFVLILLFFSLLLGIHYQIMLNNREPELVVDRQNVFHGSQLIGAFVDELFQPFFLLLIKFLPLATQIRGNTFFTDHQMEFLLSLRKL